MVTNDLLADAVLALAARDTDRATFQNDIGYNGSDSPFGNRLVEIGPANWTAAMRREAWIMLRKYSNQLAKYGVDYDAIPEPPVVAGNARYDAWKATHTNSGKTVTPATVDFKDGVFEIRFDYDATIVDAVREIPGRQFRDLGHEKFWVAPQASAPAVKAFATARGFDVSPTAEAILADAPDALVDAHAPKANKVITWTGKRFEIEFDYDAAIVAAVKTTGARFTKTPKIMWIAQESAAAAVGQFATDHGFEVVGYDFDEAIKRIESVKEASRAAAAEIEVEGLGGELRPYQKAAVAYAEAVGWCCFIADKVGLGKTVECFAITKKAEAFPAIIAVKAGLRSQWEREARKWLPGKKIVVLKSEPLPGEGPPDGDVFIVGYNTFGKAVTNGKTGRAMRVVGVEGWADLLMQINPQAIVIDEGQLIKEKGSNRSRVCVFVAENTPSIRVRLDASGTPAKNRHREYIEQLKFLGKLDEVFGDEYRFLTRYCEKASMSGYRDFTGSPNKAELVEKLRQTCMIRRTKKDVELELPDVIDDYIPLEADAKVMKDYERAQNDIVNYMIEVARGKGAADGGIEAGLRASRAEQIVQMNKLRMLAGLAKVPAVTDWVNDWLEETEDDNGKIVLFAWHNEVVDALVEAFNAPKIRGGMSDKKKDAARDQFIGDKPTRVIVCNIEAAGTGLDGLQAVAQDCKLVEFPWTPTDILQAVGRLDRSGQPAKNVFAHYGYLTGTIDEDMIEVLGEKLEIIRALDEDDPQYDEVSQKSVFGTVLRKQLARRKVQVADEIDDIDGDGLTRLEAEVKEFAEERDLEFEGLDI